MLMMWQLQLKVWRNRGAVSCLFGREQGEVTLLHENHKTETLKLSRNSNTLTRCAVLVHSKLRESELSAELKVSRAFMSVKSFEESLSYCSSLQSLYTVYPQQQRQSISLLYKKTSTLRSLARSGYTFIAHDHHSSSNFPSIQKSVSLSFPHQNTRPRRRPIIIQPFRPIRIISFAQAAHPSQNPA